LRIKKSWRIPRASTETDFKERVVWSNLPRVIAKNAMTLPSFFAFFEEGESRCAACASLQN
jgi:hypothetical protein